MDHLNSFKDKLQQTFAVQQVSCELINDQITLVLPADHIVSVCQVLRDDRQFSFVQLSDLCGVDYSSFGEVDWATEQTSKTGFSRARQLVDEVTANEEKRFAVVYHLLSIEHNIRLRLRCYVVGEPPQIASVTNIWSSANWFEREAFDLYGIVFNGHPDLRRILTDYGFIGHPFRKDFPLEGNVELRYDEDKKRVVYQPVSIENRVLVPRVKRDSEHAVISQEVSNNG